MKNVFLILFCLITISGCTLNKTAPKAQIPSPKESSIAPIVPLPTEEGIIRTFFNLVEEKRIPEAIGMMNQTTVPDDAAKQAWAVQFNSFQEISLKSIEHHNKESWTPISHTYKIFIIVKMKPEAASAVIPNYGWENGDNIRWITVEQDASGLWKISEISTGP